MANISNLELNGTTYNINASGSIPTTEKGTANGVASLDSTGKVPSSQLPESLALGETSSTAYRGDRGKAAYDHSQTTSGNPHNVTKSDVGLGNVGNFKAVSTVASQGLSDTEKANARANIGAGTGNGTYSKPSGGIPKSDLATDVQTSLGKADSALQSFTETDPTVPSWAKQSSKPSYTYSEVGAAPASHSHSQLITAGDNRKVSTKPNDYSNVMRFQGIKEKSVIGNPSSDSYSYLVGLRGWSDDSGGNAHEFAFNNTGIFTRSGATTSWGSWSKLAMTSDIPSSLPASDVYSWAKQSSKPSYTQDEVSDGSTYKRVTSTEKSTWNSKYSKPSGGIPKTDLASAVQTSLGLADKSLPHTTVSGSPDLDTYTTTGVYHIVTSSGAHAPTTNHATLFVDATVGTPYQIFKPDNVDTTWYTRHRSGSAWTAWVAMKFTDTTYSAATTSAAGLMSATDKTKLNGIASGAQVNDNGTNIAATTFATLADSTVMYEGSSIVKQGKHISGWLTIYMTGSSSHFGPLVTINSAYRPASTIHCILGQSDGVTDIEVGTNGVVDSYMTPVYAKATLQFNYVLA